MIYTIVTIDVAIVVVTIIVAVIMTVWIAWLTQEGGPLRNPPSHQLLISPGTKSSWFSLKNISPVKDSTNCKKPLCPLSSNLGQHTFVKSSMNVIPARRTSSRCTKYWDPLVLWQNILIFIMTGRCAFIWSSMTRIFWYLKLSILSIDTIHWTGEQCLSSGVDSQIVNHVSAKI